MYWEEGAMGVGNAPLECVPAVFEKYDIPPGMSPQGKAYNHMDSITSTAPRTAPAFTSVEADNATSVTLTWTVRYVVVHIEPNGTIITWLSSFSFFFSLVSFFLRYVLLRSFILTPRLFSLVISFFPLSHIASTRTTNPFLTLCYLLSSLLMRTMQEV